MNDIQNGLPHRETNGQPDTPGHWRAAAHSINNFDQPAQHLPGAYRSDELDDPEAEWLSVAEAVTYCSAKGLNRNIKTVRRWAHRSFAHPESAEVLARKQDTETDFRYVIERRSLDVKIAQELEFEAKKNPQGMSGHDHPRPDTPGDSHAQSNEDLLQRTEPDVSAHDRPSADMPEADFFDSEDEKSDASAVDDPFFREQIEEKDRQIGRLHTQLERRDEQIMSMLERDRETNILIKGLQEALLPASRIHDQRTRRLDVRSAISGDKPGEQEDGDGVY